jgi:hypothetical protein
MCNQRLCACALQLPYMSRDVSCLMHMLFDKSEMVTKRVADMQRELKLPSGQYLGIHLRLGGQGGEAGKMTDRQARLPAVGVVAQHAQ